MIVLTDIHGCYKSLLALIAQLPKGEPLAFCGDLVDRGPGSMQVVQYAIDNNIPCVKGNHEDMMVKGINECLQDGPIGNFQLWMMNGGFDTMKSYEAYDQITTGRSLSVVDGDAQLPELLKDHVKWMEALPTYLQLLELKNERGQTLLLTHAGANCAFDTTDIMWNRWPPEESKKTFNIFGHTPRSYWKPAMEVPAVTNYYACVDTGCAYGGKLTAIQFPSMKIWQQDNIE